MLKPTNNTAPTNKHTIDFNLLIKIGNCDKEIAIKVITVLISVVRCSCSAALDTSYEFSEDVPLLECLWL